MHTCGASSLILKFGVPKRKGAVPHPLPSPIPLDPPLIIIIMYILVKSIYSIRIILKGSVYTYRIIKGIGGAIIYLIHCSFRVVSCASASYSKSKVIISDKTS